MQQHYAYIIFDKDGHTYVGYTVDPERRIRQHNGLLAGGARFTTRHASKTNDPNHWRFLITVHSPELVHRTALSLEWSLKYPNNKRPASFRTPEARIKALPLVFQNPKFSSMKFQVHARSDEHLFLLKTSLANIENVDIIS